MFSAVAGGLEFELLEGDDAMTCLFSSAIIPAQLNPLCAAHCSVSNLNSFDSRPPWDNSYIARSFVLEQATIAEATTIGRLKEATELVFLFSWCFTVAFPLVAAFAFAFAFALATVLSS